MLIVLTTTADIETAEDLAEKLIAARLAACEQILPQMTSYYVWGSSPIGTFFRQP